MDSGWEVRKLQPVLHCHISLSYEVKNRDIEKTSERERETEISRDRGNGIETGNM